MKGSDFETFLSIRLEETRQVCKSLASWASLRAETLKCDLLFTKHEYVCSYEVDYRVQSFIPYNKCTVVLTAFFVDYLRLYKLHVMRFIQLEGLVW